MVGGGGGEGGGLQKKLEGLQEGPFQRHTARRGNFLATSQFALKL